MKRARLFKLLLWSAVLVVTALLALLWLAGREWTLQTALAEFTSRTNRSNGQNGEITITGARGGLYNGFIFDRIEIRSPDKVIVLEQGVILWEPAMWLSKTLLVKRAHITRVHVDILRPTPPLTEPASLEVPFTLLAPQATIGAVEIREAGNTTRFTAIELGAAYRGKQWQLERVAVTTPWGAGKASLTLDAAAPFALKGEVVLVSTVSPEVPSASTLTPPTTTLPYRVNASLAGKLAAIDVASQFSVKDAQHGQHDITGRATATLAPFMAQPLVHATVNVPQLNLQSLDQGLPESLLAIDLKLAPAAANSFKGAVNITNASPGSLDQARLPLTAMTAQFTADPKRIELSEALIDLGEAGQFRGSARYQNNAAINLIDRFTLVVNTQNLNLNGLHSKLRKTVINGNATIAPEIARKNGGTSSTKIAGVFREANLALNLSAHADRDTLRIDRAELMAGKGKLSLTGQVELAGERAFQATGKLTKFNAADLGAYPATDLNADFQTSGSAAAAWRVNLATTLQPSRLFAQPLSGKAKLVARADSLRDVDIALALGANQLRVSGGLGRLVEQKGAEKVDPKVDRVEPTLDWNINAPQLAQFDRDMGGSLIAKGSVIGALLTPRIDAQFDGKALRFKDHRLKSMQGSLRGTLPISTVGQTSIVTATKMMAASGKPTAAAAFTAEVKLTEYTSPKFSLARANAKFAGSRADHTLAITASDAEFDIRLQTRGGLDNQNRWRGEVVHFDNRGTVPFNLLAAAPLSLTTSGQVLLGATKFDVGGGKLEIAQFRWADGAVATRGKGSGLPLALVRPFVAALKNNVETTLKLGVEWDFNTASAAPSSPSAAMKMNGKLRLFRESGDIRFLPHPPFTAGLETFDFKTDIADNIVKATLQIAGKNIGRVDVAASTRLQQRAQTWGVPATAPVSLQGDVDLPTVAWLTRIVGGPRAGPTHTLDGRLRATVTAAGTFGEPKLSGRAIGSALHFVWPEYGINYKSGTLDATFSDDTLRVKQLGFTAGEGNLQAEGTLHIAGLKSSGRLTVKVDRFEAAARPDRLVVATGEGSLALDENRMTIVARLKADRGFFELPEKSDVTISDDVVVIGKSKPVDKPENKMTTQVDLDIDLGRQFQIRGAGLNGRLAGSMRVVSVGNGLPRAVGTLNIEDGIYSVYGQKLTIERGTLTFAGPIQNPGIDLYAVRKNPQPSLSGVTVEAGVEVRGSALAPRARLVSTPDVPETEKLSWLVLGRGLESSSTADFNLLSAAASGLLGSSRAASVQSRIAGALGVDEFGISPPSGGQGGHGGLLTVGKRISARLFVVYEQGLGTVSNVLKVRYQLSNRWSVQAQAGTESAVDALYTLRFD